MSSIRLLGLRAPKRGFLTVIPEMSKALSGIVTNARACCDPG